MIYAFLLDRATTALVNPFLCSFGLHRQGLEEGCTFIAARLLESREKCSCLYFGNRTKQ
jgi:hypothetical protein